MASLAGIGSSSDRGHQDIWHMMYVVGALRDSQREVIELGSGHPAPQTPRFDQRLPAKDHQRSKIVHRKQQVGGPVWFEERVPALHGFRVDAVVIAVDQSCFGVR